MLNQKVIYKEIVNHLPPQWEDATIRESIVSMIESSKLKIVVLDDDPTGVQTIHDILVLTQWDKVLLKEAFHDSQSIFFILTNTRAMTSTETERINREIAINVLETAKEEGYNVQFVSRSDSTLRGHYPLEIDVLSDESRSFSGEDYDGHLIIPAFFEGGRYTYQNVHYLKENECLTPVHQTEFAQDKVFGFAHSNLCEWVEEKTHNRIAKEQCVTIQVEQLRQGPDTVEQILLGVQSHVPVIVNAMSYSDLNVLSLALHRAFAKGKRFVYRTAASFVKSFGGISDKEYLSGDMMIAKGSEQAGGVIIVGSHTAKTTQQLENLIQGTGIDTLEMNVEKILNEIEKDEELERLTKKVNESIRSGKDIVVYSSRKLVVVEQKEANLQISQTVSSSLVGIIQKLETPPKFIIAKGGITSSDVATIGLNIKKAKVLGQAAPGIPVWLTGDEAKFRNIPYIVFPGNVGGEFTLLEIVNNLSNR